MFKYNLNFVNNVFNARLQHYNNDSICIGYTCAIRARRKNFQMGAPKVQAANRKQKLIIDYEVKLQN